MPNLDPIRYRDTAGVWHQLTVTRTEDGIFEVTDTNATDDRQLVIDTLAGYGDGPEQAQAVARAYAAQHHHPEP